MMQKAVGEAHDALFDAFAKMLADAAALVDRALVVLLKKALARSRWRAGQPRTVQQPVENSEVLEALLVEDRREIEFDVSLAPHEGRVSQQAQGRAIGDKAPEMFGAIEVFLHERMRSKARAAGSIVPTPPVARRGASSSSTLRRANFA